MRAWRLTSGRLWRVCPAPTRPIRNSVSTCCRTSISPSGAASPSSTGRCSERTWIYRVAHNVAISHTLKRRRQRSERLATLEELAAHPDPAAPTPETEAGEQQALARLMSLVRQLAPPDRQVLLLYLEGLDAAAIGEVCGLTPGAVAMKVHRLKAVLVQRFSQRGSHAG